MPVATSEDDRSGVKGLTVVFWRRKAITPARATDAPKNISAPAIGRVAGIETEAGTAYVFYRDLGGADAWSPAATLNPGEDPWALLFGHSVSVSGERAVVGAPWAEVNYYAQGAAYVYILPHNRIYLPLVMRTHAP